MPRVPEHTEPLSQKYQVPLHTVLKVTQNQLPEILSHLFQRKTQINKLEATFKHDEHKYSIMNVNSRHAHHLQNQFQASGGSN